MVSDEVKTQLMALRNSESDVMKCRVREELLSLCPPSLITLTLSLLQSWLRITLNKGLLITFLEDLQRHPGLLS